jgi:hypothetical protein
MKLFNRSSIQTYVAVLSCALLGALVAGPALAAKPSDKGNGWGSSKPSWFGNGKGNGQCSTTAEAPTIDGWPTFSLVEGEDYRFEPTAADANCDSLTFSIAGKPSWTTFDSATGRLAGQPPAGSAGTYAGIVISVSDGAFTTSLPKFSITVYENHPPVLTGTPPAKVVGGQKYSFTPGVFDGDGQTLRFSITGRPAWASFDSSTGALTGTPSDADAGTYSGIAISVTDGLLSDSLGPFGVTVESGNRAPVISGQPANQVTAGQAYGFVPSASDPDGDTLRFSVANLPPWASFDTGTGRLAGTPSESAAGEYVGIRVSVSDGQQTASLPDFSVVVEAPNRAPVISGNPAGSVTVGNAYRFVPAASDADGDALSFRIANKPAWAAFNAATGELSGSPDSSAAGLYANIQVSVSDGQASASLPAFSISVEQLATGSATLSWQPPVERTDGSPLTDLAGYRIYYGNTPDDLRQAVKLDNPGVTTYVVENLSRGTWYFAMTAVDAGGLESDHSSIGSKTIN